MTPDKTTPSRFLMPASAALVAAFHATGALAQSSSATSNAACKASFISNCVVSESSAAPIGALGSSPTELALLGLLAAAILIWARRVRRA